MHKPEAVLENETQIILWDFEIQKDHSVQARKPDLVSIRKKRMNISHSWILLYQQTTERWKKGKAG